MIPEIDIWRVAKLMLKRYGDKAASISRRPSRRGQRASLPKLISGGGSE
jgi:hypothetical protein